jgi:hypothetical protein
MTRQGAPGHRQRKKAANWSIAAAQDHFRRLLWDNLVEYLRERNHDESLLMELERRRVS